MKSLTHRLTVNHLLFLIMVFVMSPEVQGQTTWDFETGDLSGWTAQGIAFGRDAGRRQPTLENNVQIRRPGIVINHQGRYWIGTYENRPNSSLPLGSVHGDAPRGTLTSDPFVIRSRYITFLIGGGNDAQNLRVELQVRTPQNVGDPTMPSGGLVYSTVLFATGRDNEVMRRETWDVNAYVGFEARIRIVDNSSGPWGHINCDDFQFLGDLWVTGMEITQAIQVYPDNSIPLIGYKLTFVRVYLQSNEDARGAWVNVTGRLTVRNRSGADGGAPIPERALFPINGSGGVITVRPSGSGRNSMNDSLLFALDRDQTAPGEREMQVEIFETSGRIEGSSVNNMLARPQLARFSSANHRSIIGFTYTNRNTGSACTDRAPDGYRPSSFDFDSHRLYVQNVHPVSSLTVVPLPGNPQESFDNSDCHAYERAHNWLAAELARLSPSGGTRGYVLTPESNGYNGWCCNDSRGNRSGRGENLRSDYGPTMAHELAHSWNRLHTQSVGGIGIDINFPRLDGSVGSQTGMRTFPSLQVVPPTTPSGTPLGDIMSYSPPYWISPYTYCGLMSIMFGATLTCPAGATNAQFVTPTHANTEMGILAPPFVPQILIASLDLRALSFLKTQKEQTFLYVAGSINPDGKVTFEPFEMITAEGNIASKTEGETYLLVLEGKDKTVLSKHHFSASRNYDPQQRSPIRFSIFTPYDQATSRIVLYRDNKVLAERIVSANFPEIKLSALEGRKSWTGKHWISWEANDADNDKLTFTVYYSSDGDRWIPLDSSLEKNSLEIDFDNLPGADSAKIRVVASDGVNTSQATYPRTFAVPRKSPQVNLSQTQIHDISSSNVTNGAGTDPRKREISMSATQSLILQGSAFDWEDGPITAPQAFQWTSDRDGSLGYGQWVILRQLSPGRHVLTLTVYDSDKMEGRASIQITVQGRLNQLGH